MTHTMDPTDLHRLAEQVVRHIAAGTGFTTLATVGLAADGVPVLNQQAFEPVRLDGGYGELLGLAARMQRRFPHTAPAYACALVLPEHDVAYLHDHQTGTDPALVLVVGRNPVHDPDTHAEVSHGLAELMRAIADTQPPQRPTGRAFLAQPGSHLLILPDPPPRPHGYQGRHR